MGRYARLGFHSYKTPGIIYDKKNISKSKQNLTDLGVTKDFVDKIFKTPHDDIWFPSADELLSSNVVHKVVDGRNFSLQGKDNNATTHALKRLGSRYSDLNSDEEIYKNIQEDIETNRKLSLLAKSPKVVEFVEYTRQQNELVEKLFNTMTKVNEVNTTIDTVENIDLDSEMELIYVFSKRCKLLLQLVAIASDLVYVLNKKIELTEEYGGEIFQELTGSEILNDPRFIEYLSSLRDNYSNTSILVKGHYEKACYSSSTNTN